MNEALEKGPALYEERSHILIVDDDERICTLTMRFLMERGFVVLCAYNTVMARELLERFEFDVIVLDIMMPGQTGLEFAKAIRERGTSLPILFLSALGEADDKINGFESGGDDYLSKPFDPRELEMRLHALLRRTAKQKSKRQYIVHNWLFDPEFAELIHSDDPTTVQVLTESEHKLLKIFIEQNRDVISREDLASYLGLVAAERTVDVQITRLRKKLGDDAKRPRALLTIRGKGYSLRFEEAA